MYLVYFCILLFLQGSAVEAMRPDKLLYTVNVLIQIFSNKKIHKIGTQQREDEVLIDAGDAGGNAECEYGGPQPHVQRLQSATQPPWGARQ